MANTRLVLGPGNPGAAFIGVWDIFGTNAGAETVTVVDDTTAFFQGDFARGGDTIRLSGSAPSFTAQISGASLQLASLSNSLTIYVPISSNSIEIQFETAPNTFGDSRTLTFDGTDVTLGGQTIPFTGEVTVDPPAAPPAAVALFSAEPEPPQVETATTPDEVPIVPDAPLAFSDEPVAPLAEGAGPTRLVLQPDAEGAAFIGSWDIFGTNAGAENVLVADGTEAQFQGDFARGGDTVRLTGAAADFTARIAGANIELISDSDDLIVRIPIGSTGLAVQFETASAVFGDSRMLLFDGQDVLLGDQVITTTAADVQAFA